MRYYRLILLLTYSISSASFAEAISIVSNPVDSTQRSLFYKIVQDFQQLNPDISTELKVWEHETYKARISEWLTSDNSGDVFFWFAGNRMVEFVENDLLASLDELWTGENLNSKLSKSVSETVHHNDKFYALPLYYYQWGFYYRKSFFLEAKLTPPETWDDLMATSHKLKAAGVVPFALSSKNNWPAVSWFDYLNLRLNGKTFHQNLLAGKASFHDARVGTVLNYWNNLIDAGFFNQNHSDLTWKKALPLVYHKQSAMILMGNFFLAALPESVKDDIGFFPFPVINPDIAHYEEAPTDVLIVPKRNEDNEAVQKFLAYMASASVQSELAHGLNLIPANKTSALLEDDRVKQGANLISAAQGLTQFFDRDSIPAFSEPAMKVLTRFLNREINSRECQVELEALRLRHLTK